MWLSSYISQRARLVDGIFAASPHREKGEDKLPTLKQRKGREISNSHIYIYVYIIIVVVVVVYFFLWGCGGWG